ncbi:hypothetical protein BJQ89_01791 [Arthrobacter sp. ES1]|nr:hypothetical protein [Arthrobacter sp. ES1]
MVPNFHFLRVPDIKQRIYAVATRMLNLLSKERSGVEEFDMASVAESKIG